jgi:hypothetical protein
VKIWRTSLKIDRDAKLQKTGASATANTQAKNTYEADCEKRAIKKFIGGL